MGAVGAPASESTGRVAEVEDARPVPLPDEEEVMEAAPAVEKDVDEEPTARVELPFGEDLTALMERMRADGLVPGEEDSRTAQRRALLESVLHVFDPGGEVLDAEVHTRRLAERRGEFLQIPGSVVPSADGYEVRGVPESGDTGLREGDRLISVAGQAVESLSLTQLQAALRNPAGGEVIEVECERAGGEMTVAVARVRGRLPEVEASETWAPGLFYLRLNGLFEGHGRKDAGSTIFGGLTGPGAEASSGVILDLRGAGGTDLEAVAAVAGCFSPVEKLPVFALRPLHGGEATIYRTPSPATGAVEAPVMVLVDEQTRGAAEILAGVLKYSLQGAMLIGRPTAGDFLLREPAEWSSGLQLWRRTRSVEMLGDGRVLKTFSGESGVQPTIRVRTGRPAVIADPEPAPAPDDVLLPEEEEHIILARRVDGDPPLRRAVDILLGLRALEKQDP